MDKNLLKATEDYWTRRADGYSKVNQEELTGVQHTNWKQFLVNEIEKTYPGHQPSDIHILEGDSLYPSLDKEAIRVISSFPKWHPGTMGKKAVRTGFSLPVIFRMRGAKVQE